MTTSSYAAAPPSPSPLRGLRTDPGDHFGLATNINKPSAIEEQRIQRYIEDEILKQQQEQQQQQATEAQATQQQHIQIQTPSQNEEGTALGAPAGSLSATAAGGGGRKASAPSSLPASLPGALPSCTQLLTDRVFSLVDVLPFVRHGVDQVIQDDFSRCFQSAHTPAWNWNMYLYPLWCCGVFIRYFILLPIRCFCLALGFLLWGINFLFIKAASRCTTQEQRHEWERWNIRLLCSVFVFSWTGVIRYHGTLTAHHPNQIYVANHTSLIDMIILSQMNTFSLVGQQQKGFVGMIQKYVLNCLNNCWFDRSEANDRLMAAQRIKAHISDPHNNRLLIFPEGTCVNNEYCVQFKQGAFDMNAEVVPIAINVDAFWNSRAQSFPMHLLTLMSSWAVVCDVWYLPPTRRAPNETAIQFSERVKKMIADRAGLKNVHWDGYLKHFRPSSRYLTTQQNRLAEGMMKKWNVIQQKRQSTQAAERTIETKAAEEKQQEEQAEQKQKNDKAVASLVSRSKQADDSKQLEKKEDNSGKAARASARLKSVNAAM